MKKSIGAVLLLAMIVQLCSCIFVGGPSGNKPATVKASLTSISVRGVPISDFDPDVLEYDFEYDPKEGLPGQADISYTAPDSEYTVNIRVVSKTIRLVVISPDGRSTTIYVINMKEKAHTVTQTSAEIVNKNGAKGVLTLISDDGDQRTSDFFYTEIAPKYDSFKITIALPTKKVASLTETADGSAWMMDEDGNYVLTVLKNDYSSTIAGSVFTKASAYPTTVDFWKKITSTGQIEIASHSHTHAAWGLTDEQNGSYPAGNVIKEIRASAQIVRELLGQENHFLIRPGGHTDLTSEYFYNLVKTDDTYIGMRSSNGAPPFVGATTANNAKLNTVAKFKNPDGRIKIATILVRGYEAAYDETGKAFATASGDSAQKCIDAGISAWEQYVDYAIQYGSWASIGFHGVVSDSTATATGYNVFDSQVKALMDYVQPLVDSGDLWLASFSDAAKYYFEWSSASVSAVTYGTDRVEITLTDKEEDERFDEPLTVKVTVPAEWKSAELESYGEITPVDIHVDEDGTHFVYANILPGDGLNTLRAR